MLIYFSDPSFVVCCIFLCFFFISLFFSLFIWLFVLCLLLHFGASSFDEGIVAHSFAVCIRPLPYERGTLQRKRMKEEMKGKKNILENKC